MEEHYHDKIMGDMHYPKEREKAAQKCPIKDRERIRGREDTLMETAKTLISVGIIAGFGARVIKGL